MEQTHKPDTDPCPDKGSVEAARPRRADLPADWRYGYASPEGHDCPLDHFSILLCRLADPKINRAGIASRLGICGPGGSPASPQQLRRISDVLLHSPNAEWLRKTQLSVFMNQSKALLKINQAHEAIVDTVLGILEKEGGDDRIRLRAVEVFCKHFGSLALAQREPSPQERIPGLDKDVMLDVKASVVEGASDAAN